VLLTDTLYLFLLNECSARRNGRYL